MGSGPSTYLLIFRESTPERYEAMSYDERRQALLRWNAWCDALAAQGRVQAGSSLAPDGRVVSADDGTHGLDGPFSEAKEVIGGYIALSADSLDEATAIAEQCPNIPYGMIVEVRPLSPTCHLARSLGWETMREPAAADG